MALLFTYLLPLLLPIAVYMLWRLWHERALAAGGHMSGAPDDAGAARSSHEIDWRDAPWPALALVGLVLLAAVLLIGVLRHGSTHTEHYVPPRLENGQILPGELRLEEPAADRSGAGGSVDHPGSSRP